MTMPQLDRIEKKQDQILELLAQLVASLADDEDQPSTTLDGDHAGHERDQTQGLG